MLRPERPPRIPEFFKRDATPSAQSSMRKQIRICCNFSFFLPLSFSSSSCSMSGYGSTEQPIAPCDWHMHAYTNIWWKCYLLIARKKKVNIHIHYQDHRAYLRPSIRAKALRRNDRSEFIPCDNSRRHRRISLKKRTITTQCTTIKNEVQKHGICKRAWPIQC